MKNKYKTSLENLFKFSLYASIAIGATSLLFIILSIISFSVSFPQEVTTSFLILTIIFIVLLGADVGFILFCQKRIYNDNLFATIKNNLTSLKNMKKPSIIHNDERLITDFKDLNELLETTINICNQTIVYNKIKDYNEIGIEFIDGSEHVCSYQSLTKHIPDLILGNEMFRCAFVDLYYEVGKNAKMGEDTDKQLINTIIRELKYKNILIAKHNSPNPGFLVYIPYFESISQIEEEIDLLLRNLSIIQATEIGQEVVMCKAAMVAYPYSEITDIMSDLRYAIKQNKILSIFLPPYQAKQNDNLLQSTMNLANVTRFLQKFASLSFDEKDISNNSKKINKVLNQVADYYGFDTSGLIYYSDTQEKYEVVHEYSVPGTTLFAKGESINKDFINAIDRVKDEDLSYYFSSREHVNSLLASFLDYYMISSGQFYVIRDTNRIYGLVYFLNRNKSINLDAYLREGLLTFSYFISSYSREILTRMAARHADVRFNDIVRITNTKLYSIDKTTNRLVYVSDALKDLAPSIDLKLPCHKALFGLDAPCKDCPLLSRNRKVSLINNVKQEIRVGIKHNEDDTVIMIVDDHNEKSVSKDRFDPELLINSYSSFINRIDNVFIDHTNGYVLYLRLDNVKDIVEKYGNEGYSSIVKDFTTKIINKLPHIGNIYLYREDVLALIIPEANRNTIIDDVEKIYLISKEVYFDEISEMLNISYITNKYPEQYKSSVDFIKASDKKLLSKNKLNKSDYLYFTETGYSRQASREAFFLDVIDASFVKDTFGVRLQPEINTYHRIVGAETFIRLTDNYRNMTLPTGEIIAVGEKHGKITLITDALVNTIGNLYRDNGYQVFKTRGLETISINTNIDFIDNDQLLDKLGSLAKSYMVPKDFMGLEFSEEDVYKHKEDFMFIAKKIRNCDVTIIVDHYTGNKLSIEQLKQYGVTKIKFDYQLIKNITLYKSDLERVQYLSRAASDIGIKPVLIGIETPLQYDLVKDTCGDFLAQGELFCSPIEPSELITTLNKMNR